MKNRKKKSLVDKSMTFAEIMKDNPAAGKILLEKKLHCIGCPMAMQETLEQGAMMHGIDADNLVKEINAKIIKRRKTK